MLACASINGGATRTSGGNQRSNKTLAPALDRPAAAAQRKGRYSSSGGLAGLRAGQNKPALLRTACAAGGGGGEATERPALNSEQWKPATALKDEPVVVQAGRAPAKK